MNYTNDLINQLKAAIVAVLTEMRIEVSENRILLERPKSSDHGDYACNIAMQLARELKQNPREILSPKDNFVYFIFGMSSYKAWYVIKKHIQSSI